MFGQIRKFLGGDNDAYAFQLGFQLRYLVGLPLTFFRVGCGRDNKQYQRQEY